MATQICYKHWLRNAVMLDGTNHLNISALKSNKVAQGMRHVQLAGVTTCVNDQFRSRYKYLQTQCILGNLRWAACDPWEFSLFSDVIDGPLHSALSAVSTVQRQVKWWRHQMETFPGLLAICAGNSAGEFPHKGQWRGALMFSLVCVWINGWVNNRAADDLRRYCAHYDVSVM